MKTKLSRSVATLLAFVVLISSFPLDASATTAAKSLPALTGNQAYDAANIAVSQIGYDTQSENDNIYAKEIGGVNGQAWCAYFVTWCVKKAGLDSSNYPSASDFGRVTLILQWFRNKGLWHRKNSTNWTYKGITDYSTVDVSYVPNTGDLIILETNGNYASGPDHIGIVEKVSNGYVTYIHGNTGNDTVARTTYSLTNTKIWGYCSPNYKKQTQMTGYSISIDSSGVRPSSIMYVTVKPHQGTPTNIRIYFEKTDGSTISYVDCGPTTDQPLVGLPVGEYDMYAEITDEYGSYKGSKDNGSVRVISRDAEWGTNADIGSDFTAYIKHTSAGTVVTNDSPNVSSRSLTYGDNQIWKFIKLSDGSYKIVNQKDSKCLTVTTNGAYHDTINVKVDSYSGLDTQKWYVYNDGHGGYYLRPKCSINVVLDLDAALKDEGTNYQIWSYSGGITQRFNIVKYSEHTTCIWDSGKETKAPTCTKVGMYLYTCTECGKTKTSSVPATGHKGGTATCSQYAKCSVCGVNYGSLKSHAYSNSWTVDKQANCTTTGSKSHHCIYCDMKKDITSIPATGHSGGNATCSQYAECNVCGTSYGSLASHQLSRQWTVDKQATCTVAGSKSHHCIICGSKADITVIPSTGHKGGSATCKELAKCVSCGVYYGDYVQHQYIAGECIGCGKVIESQENDNSNENGSESESNDNTLNNNDSTNNTTNSDTPNGNDANKENVDSNEGKSEVTNNKKEEDEQKNDQSVNKPIVEDTVLGNDKVVGDKANNNQELDGVEDENSDEEEELFDVEVGDIFENENTADVYEITSKFSGKNTVEYLGREKSSSTIVIPDTITIDGVKYQVTSIAEGAFENNKKLTKIVIGDNVVKIGKEAFSKCKNLRNVTIGKNVTQIGNKAFYMCTKLTKITIPENVNKIGKQAFYACRKLKTITIESTKLTSGRVGAKAFKFIHSKATVKV